MDTSLNNLAAAQQQNYKIKENEPETAGSIASAESSSGALFVPAAGSETAGSIASAAPSSSSSSSSSFSAMA